MKTVRKIGLTGGIGSGKSTVAKLLQVLGYPVYSSDERARVLMNSSSVINQQIMTQLGEYLINNQGIPDRKKLAELVFSNPQKLETLNAIVHPEVRKDFETWCANQNTKVVFKEAAIIFEHGLEKELDEVWVVFADEELRISRVMNRNALSREEVLKRINNQWPAEKLNELASQVIYNNEEVALIPQVLKACESLN